MRHELLDTSSEDPSRSAGLTRAIAAALIVLGIASIAFYVQSDNATASVGDFGVASVANLADGRSTEASAMLAAPAAAAPPSASVSTQQRDEPTVEDATNPHGG